MPHSTCLVRVLFAGLHPLSREDSRLQAGKEYEMHTTSADEGTPLPSVDQLRPNIILLDLLQTGSLRTIQRVRDTSPSCRVVALIEMRRADIAESIFSAGASGVLFRSDVASELFVAIRTVRSGQRYLSPTFTKLPSDAPGEPFHSSIQLSVSDELMLPLVARDCLAHRIAQVLGLPLSTVRLSIAYLKRQFDRRTNRDLKQYVATHDLASNSVTERPSDIPRNAIGSRRKTESVPQGPFPVLEGTT